MPYLLSTLYFKLFLILPQAIRTALLHLKIISMSDLLMFIISLLCQHYPDIIKTFLYC